MRYRHVQTLRHLAYDSSHAHDDEVISNNSDQQICNVKGFVLSPVYL